MMLNSKGNISAVNLKYLLGQVLWYLTTPSTIFQLYRGGQFYWWRKPPTCRMSL